VAQQNQLNFSNTAYQRQMAALQGLSRLYGVDTNLLERTLGIPADLLNTRANASRPSGFLQFDGIEPGRDAGRAAIAVSVDIRAAVGHAKGYEFDISFHPQCLNRAARRAI
jgi:hypothetical protein